MNVSGTVESARQLVMEQIDQEAYGQGASDAFMYIANSGPGHISALLKFLRKNVYMRNHSPKAWVEFIEQITSATGLQVTIGKEQAGYLRNQKTLEKLIETCSPLQPKILNDLQYIGCTVNSPYTREHITVPDIKALPNTYWETLDELIEQVEFANKLDQQYKTQLGNIFKEIFKYKDTPVFPVLKGVTEILLDMRLVCESKLAVNTFQKDAKEKFTQLLALLDADAGIENKQQHQTLIESYRDRLETDLEALKKNAPKVVSDSSIANDAQNEIATQNIRPRP